MKFIKPEYLLDIAAEEYHAATRRGEYMSSHMLNDFRECPLKYRQEMDGVIPPKDSSSFVVGRAAHKMILEGGDEFAKEYVVSDGPINEKTGEPYGRGTKAYREWLEAQTREIISTSDAMMMFSMHAAVQSHGIASDLLSQGFAETTVRTTFCGEPVQVRPDWYDPFRGYLCDLKTCENLSTFDLDCRKWGYVNQMAFYRDAIRKAGGPVGRVYFIAVEKRAPFRVGVWMVYAETLDRASEQNAEAITYLNECRASGVWPTGYEQARILYVA